MRFLAIPVVAGVVVLGIWITGGRVTDDFALAQVLTGSFLAVAGVAAVFVGWRWRSLAWPVVATYALTAGLLGGYLLVTSTRDVTVDETVVMVDERVDAPERRPVAVVTGRFRSGEHETSGTARVVRLPEGTHVLTLTGLETDPGPDLRVYLVPGNGDSVSGHLDLGALKGNRGNQQYEIPDSAALSRYGAVVIWCRAFSVAFGAAALA